MTTPVGGDGGHLWAISAWEVMMNGERASDSSVGVWELKEDAASLLAPD